MLVIYRKSDSRIIGFTDATNLKITGTAIIGKDVVIRGIDFNLVAYDYYQDYELPRSPLNPIYLKDFPLVKTTAPIELAEEIDELKARITILETKG